MVVVQCPNCMTRYRIADKLLGKRGKCKKCGEPFTLAAPADEVEDDLLGALAQGEAQERSAAAPPPPPPPTAAAPLFPAPGAGLAPMAAPPGRQPAATGFGTYLRDVGKSLLFFTHGGDLFTFAIVVLIVFLQLPLAFVPCIGLFLVLIVVGWYMAFQLNVVLGASAGEAGLPDLATGDWMEGIILPLLKYFASWVVALVPFVIGLGYLVVFNQMDVSKALGHFGTALTGDFASAFDPDQGGGPLLGAILLLAMMLWPMMLLVVAVGGIPGLVRFDLMMLTILKSFPAYVLVVILAYAGVVGPALLSAVALAAAAEGTEGAGLLGAALGIGAAFMVLKVYANIFTMRVIGLYYPHFKPRCAWAWG
jgi:predicted Zn finger-like uncharacterized protein